VRGWGVLRDPGVPVLPLRLRGPGEQTTEPLPRESRPNKWQRGHRRVEFSPLRRLSRNCTSAGAEVRSQGDSPRWTHGFVAGLCGRRWLSRQRSARFSAADTVFLADFPKAGRSVDQPWRPQPTIATASQREYSTHLASTMQLYLSEDLLRDVGALGVVRPGRIALMPYATTRCAGETTRPAHRGPHCNCARPRPLPAASDDDPSPRLHRRAAGVARLLTLAKCSGNSVQSGPSLWSTYFVPLTYIPALPPLNPHTQLPSSDPRADPVWSSSWPRTDRSPSMTAPWEDSDRHSGRYCVQRSSIRHCWWRCPKTEDRQQGLPDAAPVFISCLRDRQLRRVKRPGQRILQKAGSVQPCSSPFL